MITRPKPRTARNHLAAACATAPQEMSAAKDHQRLGPILRQLFCRSLRARALILLTRENAQAPHYRVSWFDLTRAAPNSPFEPSSVFTVVPGICDFDRLWAVRQPAIHSDDFFNAEDIAGALVEDYRSLLVLPIYEAGEVAAVLLLLRCEANGFHPAQVPAAVCIANLIGRSLLENARASSPFRWPIPHASVPAMTSVSANKYQRVASE